MVDKKPWCDLVLPQASPEIRERGEQCCPRILCVEKTVFGWRATIQGEDEPWYEVNFFTGENGEWDVECNCGHFEIHDEPCKHIVAVAMVLDEE